MTRRDTLKCLHEPFGDAFYYGPERLSSRFENDEKTKLDSGLSQSTFRTILDRIEKEGAEVRNTPSTVISSPATPLFIAQHMQVDVVLCLLQSLKSLATPHYLSP